MQISHPRETESQGIGRNPDSMRILVIEDDRDAASWLIKGLTESGHVTDHAANGEDGLAMASENLHDILIVDRMLPKMDGLSIIRTLRSQGRHHSGSHSQRLERCGRAGEGPSRRWR